VLGGCGVCARPCKKLKSIGRRGRKNVCAALGFGGFIFARPLAGKCAQVSGAAGRLASGFGALLASLAPRLCPRPPPRSDGFALGAQGCPLRCAASERLRGCALPGSSTVTDSREESAQESRVLQGGGHRASALCSLRSLRFSALARHPAAMGSPRVRQGARFALEHRNAFGALLCRVHRRKAGGTTSHTISHFRSAPISTYAEPAAN
jgi:hypothetical protein